MPFYEYLCEHGERIEIMSSYEARPKILRCKKHDAPANLVPSIPAPAQGCDSPLSIHGDMRFPYYSQTFKCEVQSMAHHKELADARGLVWAPDYDAVAPVLERDRKAAEEDAVADEYFDQLENDPAYSKFRRLRDQGYFDPKPEEMRAMQDGYEANVAAAHAQLAAEGAIPMPTPTPT